MKKYFKDEEKVNLSNAIAKNILKYINIIF